MLAKNDVFELIKENLLIDSHGKVNNFQPLVFFSDGGCYLDEYNSFMTHTFINETK